MRLSSGVVFLSMLLTAGDACPGDYPPGYVHWWVLQPPAKDAKPLLTERQLKGIYLAYNRTPNKPTPPVGGWFGNFPSELRDKNWGAKNVVSLMVFPEERVKHLYGIGIAARLVNRRDENVIFDVSDYQLWMVQEARDKDGKWRAIELFHNSGCWHSIGEVFLKPNQYWQFPVAIYDGPLATKLRLCLHIRPHWHDRAKAETIYSNEFDGAIHPGQFTFPKLRNE